MIITLVVVVLILVIGIIFFKQPKFGKRPSGERLETIRKSPNYRNGAFQNLSHTPALAEGISYYKVFKEFFFERKGNLAPKEKVPTKKTNLHNLDPKSDVLIWFGHSSYFIQLDGKRILVDPVLSGSASPFSFSIKPFKGTQIYAPEDIPEIDFLFLSHDHWDHLDYLALQMLRPKISKVICGLGVGAHLEHWGYDAKQIIEKDWHQKENLGSGFVVNTVPARHFSGRAFVRNKSLWMAYVLKTPTMKLFIGGDSGYDKHFRDIGKDFGPFDLAILENGQYNYKWKYIHTMPDEILKIAKELGAKRILPVHNSKFVLASHSWDEPMKAITENNKNENLEIISPLIGETVYLKDVSQEFTRWWETLN